MKLKLSVFTLCFFALASISNVWADESMIGKLQSMIEDMQKSMASMQRTIDQQNVKIRSLENREPQVEIKKKSAGHGSAVGSGFTQGDFDKMLAKKIGDSDKWLKDLKFKSDLRLRYEAFEFDSGHPSESDDRNRFRYRLRFGFEKKLTDEFMAGFELVSGEATNGQNVDPTSTNTTFDNLFNFKDIFIGKAFATYTPKWAVVGPIEKVTITGGKMSNPFEKGSSDLVWDRDVTPEGAAEKIDVRLVDTEDLKVKAYGLFGQFILDEDSAASNNADAELFAFQAGLDTKLATPLFEKPVGWFSAFSWYSYSDYTNVSNFMVGTTSLARGNSNFVGSAAELDAGDFEVLELYNELTFEPFADIPIKPFFDIATNVQNESQQNDEGWAWAFGGKIGEAKKKGGWEASYTYKKIENDSVAGAFNDSDFGLGHSGKRGSQFKLAYALTDNIQLGAAAFFVNNLATGTGSVRDEEQRRFQVDMAYKFA